MNTRSHVRPSAPAALAALLLLGIAPGLGAATLEVQVQDASGLAIEHAVVSLHDGTSRRAPEGTRATMDQRARQFAPSVVPIQAGTDVSFPNSDDVRHHVYSFSYPNAFELKLYHGEASEPVRFDEPGVVVLGCNIHDGMIGYLHVVDTPLFAKSAATGTVRIDDAPAGDYTLQFWHPDLGVRYLRRPVTLGGGTTRLRVTFDPSAVDGATLAAGTPARVVSDDDAALGRELGSLFD